LNVDPPNRLGAAALEADWNGRIRLLDSLQQEHERQQCADRKLLGSDARAQIRALAEDFPRVWSDERVVPLERRLLRLSLFERKQGQLIARSAASFF